MAESSGGFGDGAGKFLGLGTHEMMLQDDGDFEIIIENAAETDDGAFGGESSTCADGEKDLVSFEEQYQNMIKEQLGGLLQEYFAHKQKGDDSPPAVANGRERSGAGCSSTFKILHKSCLREFEIVKKLNKNKDRKEKREIVLSCPNGTPATEATMDSMPPDAALQSATYDREELHLIRSRTISRQEEVHKLGGAALPTSSLSNGRHGFLESIAEQQETFGLGGNSFHKLADEEANEYCSALAMAEMDCVAVD